QAGFLTCGSSFPYAFPCAGRAQWLIVGSLTAYSGGTVMASHHLPLTLSPVKLNLPPFRSVVPVSLSSDPTRPVDTCRPSEIVIRYTLIVKRFPLHVYRLTMRVAPPAGA